MSLRPGRPGDAVTVAALAVQVFLDTYATEGVRPDLAREAFRGYSESAFLQRLSAPGRSFVLAETDAALVGFVELDCSASPGPVQGLAGAELVCLYVQPQAQRAGVGSALLREAEAMAQRAGASSLWLSAWEGNARALAFYARAGYDDVGASEYTFEGRAYANRVFAKRIVPG
ncbi:MAG TPA: GNAT family N-acetyltransferase [Ramlibacter sp.]|nr:GNAT family N-acetyltransferase [Ramlibacter sp.]